MPAPAVANEPEVCWWGESETAYMEGLLWSRHRPSRSEILASPTHITVSAPPQYIFTVPSGSGTAPQVNTTLWTYPVISHGSSGCKIHESPTPIILAGFCKS